ncbi:MAG: DUF996 domain-containing protein [Candidatus Bathyarchaeota archaeon]|nr:DUF996 domain-containing protein [Candidatus Bathyarchaeota archaeon]
MNVNFEYSKTLAGEGAILLLLGLIPYVGWVLAIVGIVLLMKSMREFSYYYQDEGIYKNALSGIKYYVVAIVAAAVAIAAVVAGAASATAMFTGNFVFTAGFAVALGVFFAGLIIAFIFYVLAATHLRKVFDALAEKSGEASFTTAGSLLWWGSVFTIIGVGLLLILIAWIFATIGFFSMKSRQYQQYIPQPNSFSQPPPPQAAQEQTLNQNYTNQP